MSSMNFKASLLCVMIILGSTQALAMPRGDWSDRGPDRERAPQTRPAETQPVPPPGTAYRPPAERPVHQPAVNKPAYRQPGSTPVYRPLPAYPPNWRPPYPLPPGGWHPPYPPPPGYRPYPPPPGFPAGAYPPSYYPGYRPPVLVYPYSGYTPGQVIAGALVVGMVISALSDSAEPAVVNNNTYYYDGEYYYEPVTDGMDTVYKVVDPPNYDK